jgi:DNA adenine methylase
MIGPLPYVGGKNRLAKYIVSLFPKHTTYVEAFAGGAQVFYRKEPSEVEVLNDLDDELFNFLRVLQNHSDELTRILKNCIVSRTWHSLFSRMDPTLLTDVQRAARFFYLQKNSFGGLIVKRCFHYGIVQRPNFNPERIPSQLQAAADRLKNVQLEHLPYQDVLVRYDRPTTLFYLDPPYFGIKLYRHNLERRDFERMAELLQGVKGKFLLSLNDHRTVREIFSSFNLMPIKLAYSAQMTTGRRFGEVIVTNFDCPAIGDSITRVESH